MELTQISMFDPDTDISSVGPRWQLWLSRLENFFLTLESEPASAKKLAFLLHCSGPRVLELYQTVKDKTSTETDVFIIAKEQLATLFNPKRNKTVERFEFRRTRQLENETIEQFATRLRLSSQYCEFGNSADDEIAGQVVQACNSDKLRRQLLQIDPLTLNNVLERGRVHDSVEAQARALESKPGREQANFLNSKAPPNGQLTEKSRFNNQIIRQNGSTDFSIGKGRQSRLDSSKCANCGGQYPHRDLCPAFKKTCSSCKKANHFAHVCMSSQAPQTSRSQNFKPRFQQNRPREEIPKKARENDHVNTVQTHSADSFNWSGPNRETLFHVYSGGKLPRTTITVNNSPVEALVDTGCSTNILDETSFNALSPKPELKQSTRKVFSYQASSDLKTLGEFSATVCWHNFSVNTTFIVAKGCGGSLLGYTSAVQLGIVSVACSVEEVDPAAEKMTKEFPSVFSGKIGKLKNFQLHLHVDLSIKPVAQRHRLVPFHLREELEKELNKRVEQGIIQPVFGQPTEWVSNLVIFFKPNSKDIRMCFDYRDLNRAIKRERHLLPTLEELVQLIQGAELFTKFDCNSAFEQVELDEESRPLTTFSSHMGLYQSLRLNLGISSAPEIFHNLMRKILSSLLLASRCCSCT